MPVLDPRERIVEAVDIPALGEKLVDMRDSGRLNQLTDYLMRDAENSLQNMPPDQLVNDVGVMAGVSTASAQAFVDLSKNIERHRQDLIIILQSALGEDKVDRDAPLEKLMQQASAVETDPNASAANKTKAASLQEALRKDLELARELLLKEAKPLLERLATELQLMALSYDTGTSSASPEAHWKPQNNSAVVEVLSRWLLEGDLDRLGYGRESSAGRLETEAKAMAEVGKALAEKEEREKQAETMQIEADLQKVRDLVLRLKFIDPELALSAVGIALSQTHFIDERFLIPESAIVAVRT